MSGILNNRQRILDSIVTYEGRRQMSTGKFVAKYVTFSDCATFYEADVVSGSSDASNRLFFECCNLPQDQITFETDDAGKLQPFKNQEGITVYNGLIFSGSDTNAQTLIGEEFASTADFLLGSTLSSFRNLQTIGTVDSIFEDEQFLLSDLNVNFKITNDNPIKDISLQNANINELDSFFNDPCLSRLPNFQYLPPINLLPKNVEITNVDAIENYRLGSYSRLGSDKQLQYDEIEKQVLISQNKGNLSQITFDPTSIENNIACQIFELSNNQISKLDVIDFGKFKSDDPRNSDKHVLFAGKVFVDDFGSHTFVKIFTIIFE